MGLNRVGVGEMLAGGRVARDIAADPTDYPRVLIVDDSAVARAVMARLVDASDHFVVTGAVATASAALAFLAVNRVDYILLDVAMPGVDGLTAMPDIVAAAGGARILVVSSSAGEGATTTIQALALGAADTLVKPGVGERSGHFGEALLDKLRRLDIPAGGDAPMRAPELPSSPALPPAGDFDIVAIGASTGGIHALSQLLRALPVSASTPILVTQHLPASFMPYFAAQLAVLAGRPCAVATDLVRIRPGRILVAPGDAHLRCVRLPDGNGAIRLVTQAAASGCMPSVDPMLASVAKVYGKRALAVMLSGMGRDGLDGARAVSEAGGFVVAQDQASSVVWGMPGAVASAGLAAAILPPDAIGRFVALRRSS